MDLLGQLPPEADLNTHDDSAVGRMQHDDAPPPSDIYSHPLQHMPPAGPSSLSMSREQFPEKSQSHAVSQEPLLRINRNPSLSGRSGIAETEYPETLPPPYASEVSGGV